MKKVLSIVALATAMLIAGKATAQLSVNGGLLGNVNSVSYKYTDINGKEVKKDSTENAGIGLYAGVSYNIPISQNWGIAPGVYLNYVGKNKEEKAYTVVLDMVDLNIPILFNYKHEFTGTFGIMGFVGPNVRYGLMANQTIKVKNPESVDKTNLYSTPAGAKNPYLTRFDLGLTFGVGVHFNAFRIETGFNVGLIDRDPEKNFTQNFHQFFVGVGYVF